jgi:RNA polymerase sigma factor (sigma-70 family)
MATDEPENTCAEYSKELLKFFKRKSPSRRDHEDLVQETLLEAWKSKERYQDQGSYKKWLFTIANRVWITSLKYDSAKKRRDSEGSFERCDGQEVELIQDAPPIDGLVASKFKQSLDALPEDVLNVVLLKAQGYSDHVCAALLKIKSGKVRDHYQTAKAILAGKVRS